MILAWAVVLGLLASLARHRGRVASQLAGISLHSAWLALVALAIQYPLLRAPGGATHELGVEQTLFLLTHVLLLAFVWLNRRYMGIQIMGLGVALNLAAILANGGLMPITPETLVQINPGNSLEQWPIGTHYAFSKDVILSREGTRLWALSDVLVIPPPFPWPAAFSLGDLLIAVGIIALLQGPGTQLELTKENRNVHET